jgi:hypothetical protein
VRLIRYTLDDPNRPGHRVEHRLITSLVDPHHAGAEELVVAYHFRWEFESTVDEMKSHQRTPQEPLRSKEPVGVIQEIYGLLIAHYVVRAVMVEAARTVMLPPSRLSFTNTAASHPGDDPRGATQPGGPSTWTTAQIGLYAHPSQPALPRMMHRPP